MTRFIFPQWTDTFKKWVGLLVAGAPVYLVAVVAFGITPEAIRIGYAPKQPVPYSHALHVGQLGLDCRYCHNTVEKSSHAAVPPAATCMNCHTGIHPESKSLLPIRESFAAEAGKPKPVEWVRVHDLPDYVYFNHSAHVTRGIGCESCHGRVDQMEVVRQVKALTMTWCLDCHRDPSQHLRPPEQVTVMGYEPEGGQLAMGQKVQKDNHINPPTNCSTCHR